MNNITLCQQLIFLGVILLLVMYLAYNITFTFKKEKSVVKCIIDSMNGVPYDGSYIPANSSFVVVAQRLEIIVNALENKNTPEANKAIEWLAGIDAKSTMIIYLNKITKGLNNA